MTEQKPALVLTAMSASSGTAVCSQIETAIRDRFADQPIYWAYNARTVQRARQQGTTLQGPGEILNDLAATGHHQAIVQSLHLLPGFEFHQLYRQVRRIQGLDCRLGMPLFSAPDDYRQLADLLGPVIGEDERQAVLLVGHGTRHPVWTAYLALEHLLRRRLGERLFVGVVEHYPDMARDEGRLVQAGFGKVLVIPFFLTTGLHTGRDLFDDNGHSWYSRLRRHGLAVSIHRQGLGMLPGIGELVAQHIAQAQPLS
ncbi:MAG: sirohydrochlorin cobaltochelatase [Desulfopila sp.]